jgi:hypothetical protein
MQEKRVKMPNTQTEQKLWGAKCQKRNKFQIGQKSAKKCEDQLFSKFPQYLRGCDLLYGTLAICIPLGNLDI